MDWTIPLILLGAFAGGFVNGLTGFGTAMAAMPLWLMVAPPIVVAQISAACGAAGQLQTIRAIWHAVTWRHVAPICVAGLAGMPVGLWLLPQVAAGSFKLGFGTLLVVYCLFMLLANGRVRLTKRRPALDLTIGFAGGITGGLAGLSGAFPTMWATVQGWSKGEKRALIQMFNLAILSSMLVGSAVVGLLTLDVLRAVMIALPGTIVGSQIGSWLYRRLDEKRFDRIVLAVLFVSGVILIASWVQSTG